ncbi:WD repeat-containing protein 35, partial [Geodia barretti]
NFLFLSLSLSLQSEIKQRAQVATYFEKFDEAERLYLELDCQNLAVDLRVKLGDWFKVVNLLKKGGGAAGDDALLTNTWNTIGDHYYDRQQWARAADYYTQGHNSGRLAECYYSLEEYDRLEQLADSLPENNPLLTKLATMFVMVGMCDQAVKAFTKVNMIDEAIDCCVQLNQWDRAIELSRRHSSRDINSLLVKCAVNLLDKEKILGAIELYPNISLNCVLDFNTIERHHRHVKTQAKPAAKEHSTSLSHSSTVTDRKEEVQATLASLLQDDFSEAVDSSLVDNAWRGAEAYHFFMLAQRELYSGAQETSLKIALYLRDFEDVLPVHDLYCLLALSAIMAGAYGVASKAFIKLESMSDLPDSVRTNIENISVEIFVKYPPQDTIFNQIQCPRCDSIINEWTHFVPAAIRTSQSA